ncbi:MAG: hypothetical protein GQ527_06615 [Bacteroidales bacterium]|nr:hypothetical protein [Bacteroidales bacterium]
MIEVVSYWKASCSPDLIIKPFQLQQEQINWWKKLYFQGLGEFFYLNSIETNAEDFIHIICESERKIKPYSDAVNDDKVMIPIGGGKDSIVSIEVMKDLGLEIIPMVVNPRGATIDTIINAGFKKTDAILTKRSIDPQLLELNSLDYLNGHTPFSAMLAFLSLMISRLVGIKFIALSNESSANEPTVEGTNINHQYSKSIEFENDFRDYYKNYLHDSQEYFSFLRPLSELQIACLFSKFTWHHADFRSCNVGSKENVWCGSCPKCLFTYVLLSPFISQEKMHKIFGKKLLNDLDLKPVFQELRGLSKSKPFECVGTVAEVELALENAKTEFFKESLMYDIKAEGTKEPLQAALKEWNIEHHLPKKFELILEESLKKCWN